MKKLFTVAFALAFTANIFAVDFGGLLGASTDFKFDGNKYDAAKLEQQETLSGWLRVPFDEYTALAVEASVQHKLNAKFGDNSECDNNIILDLNLLKFSKIFKFDNANLLELAVGRMFVADSTALIFAQPNDGVSVKYTASKFELFGYAGYSGLLNIKNVSILSSAGNVFFLPDEKKVYDFAAPYLTTMFSATLPYLFAEQTLSAEVMLFLPAGGPSELPDDEKTRFYTTAMLNGPLMPALFYDASLTLGLPNLSKLSLLTKLDLIYYASFKNASISLNAIYASGSGDALSPFVGFTKITSCNSAQEPIYSGITKFGITASVLPIKPLYISAGASVVLKKESSMGYYGFEIDANAKWQPFSDLQVTLGASTFIAKDEDNNRTEITLGGALAF